MDISPVSPFGLRSSFRTQTVDSSQLSPIRRVASSNAETGGASPSSSPLQGKSFWDVGAYGVESRISLQSTDGEKWTRTQVSKPE